MDKPVWNLEKLPQLLGRTVDDGPLISPLRNEPNALILSGIADTKVYVNCEWLLDKFSQRYPAIPVKKKPFSQTEWPDFRQKLTAPTGWPDGGDVIVYREALGHPLLFIGGLERFRLYLNQLYQFTCPLIPESAVTGYMADNRAELEKVEEIRNRPPDPEDVWRIAVVSVNHLEIVPLLLVDAFGRQDVLGQGRRVELTVHNATAGSDRLNFRWNQEAINDYLSTDKWRHPQLKSATYTPDLPSALRQTDLIVLLLAFRPEMYDAIEGRVYSIREGMDEDLRAIICQELFNEINPIVTALSQAVELDKTRLFLTSTRFKTPLSVAATYMLQKLPALWPANLMVDCVAIDRSYRSVIAEELGVRTADVLNTTVWGDIGGTMLMDPTGARILGHKGVIESPKSMMFFRPLLDVYWNGQKLQVEFAVDAPRRANYRELLEGARCSSLLIAESAINFLRLWHGTFTATSPLSPLTDPRSIGVITTKDTGPAVIPGLILAIAVVFKSDGTYEILPENTREEIRTILKKASIEVTEMLSSMKKHVDPSLVEPARTNVPEISLLQEIDSSLHVTSFRLVGRAGEGSQEFPFNITDSEIVP